jgi:hypothetical protein
MFGYRATLQTLNKLKERRTQTLGSGRRPAEATPATIYRYAYGFYRHAALIAGMRLDIFSHLDSGARTAAELGEELEIAPQRLKRLLDALVVAELLTIEGDRYANTAESSTYLVRGKPDDLGGVERLWLSLWQASLRTAETLRNGEPAARHPFTAMTDHELAVFFRALHPAAPSGGHAMVAVLGLAPHHRLLEIGGGSAGLSIAACHACPELHATVVEMPHVAEQTRRLVAECRMSGRIEVVAADVTSAPPPGRHDVAVLRNFLQVLGPSAAGRACRNVAASLMQGATLHVLGWMLNDDGLRPSNAVLLNLLYLNIFEEGAAHRAVEIRRWLEGAGLVDLLRHDGPASLGAHGLALVSGRKP